MKKVKGFLTTAGCAMLLGLSTPALQAQQERPNRGDFNPEEFRQRMMDRLREQFEVKDDAEWKIISDRLNKVFEMRRDIGFGGGMGAAMFGRGPREGERGPERREPGGDRGGDRSGERRRFGGPPNPEAEALQKAIESKASAEEIKAKLEKLREARKARQAQLAKAQDELRQVLSVRQEATAVMMGFLD